MGFWRLLVAGLIGGSAISALAVVVSALLGGLVFHAVYGVVPNPAYGLPV